MTSKLPQIENTYIEHMMQANNAVYSSYLDKDYLLTEFILENKSNFKTSDLLMAKERLESLSATELLALNDIEFKDPVISITLSVLIGGLGVDRFYIGDIGLGVAKLLTGGGLGIWWLVDMFIISGKTKKNNARELNETLMLQDLMSK
jgi:TM2 domain-containing membrane protein YozV